MWRNVYYPIKKLETWFKLKLEKIECGRIGVVPMIWELH